MGLIQDVKNKVKQIMDEEKKKEQQELDLQEQEAENSEEIDGHVFTGNKSEFDSRDLGD